ncbi:GNAT family N-acetyltransferase [Lysinibacillus sp. NPDC097195]|uniref:GNAT family N-acetyltransferase n=1 Tax=Lysinibacillus sp. NPDC097195 TaxID=3364141 RepID=UPI0038188812
MIKLQLIRIRTDDELVFYKELWDGILANEHNDNPFIEYTWFYNWWITVGKKERVELYAVQNNGDIIAFVPFTVQQQWGVRIYAFAGERIAHYTGIVARKGWQLPALAFVLDELIKKHRHVVFAFHGLLESKESSKVIEQYLVERQMRPHIFRVVTPFLAFNEVDVPSYINKHNHIHAVEQREKKLRNFGLLRRIAPKQEELHQLFHLYERRWTKKRTATNDFTKGKKKDFFEQLLTVNDGAMRVEVEALAFDNQWLAFSYGISCRGRYVTYALGHEPNFVSFGLEHLLNQSTIKRTFTENYRLYDMAMGMEPSKLEWRSGMDFTRRIIASSKTKRAKLMRSQLVLKQRFKELFEGTHPFVKWTRHTFTQLRYLGKYGKGKDWLEYGQQFVEKFVRLKLVELYELSPNDRVIPQQPVGELFEEMTMQEAMQTDQQELISLLSKGYIIYKDSFAQTIKPAFALHKETLRVDALDIVEPLPKHAYFLSYNLYKNIEVVTAFMQKIKPNQTLWMTASFWQWRKRKRLQQIGYKRISRMKHFKCARYERNHVENYTENGGDVHSIH